MLGTRGVLALLALTGSGCSFLFVDGPPAAHTKLPFFECTSSVTLPTIDLVIGAVAGIQAGAVVMDPNNSSTESAIVAAGEAALFTASAIYGYNKTAKCREAKSELLDRMMRNSPAPSFAPPAPGFPGPYQPPAPYDPWLTPPPGAFSAPPPAAPGPATPPPPPAPGPAAAPPPAVAPPTAPAQPISPPAPPAKPAPAVDDETPSKGR
jgi:hypothetical protein